MALKGTMSGSLTKLTDGTSYLRAGAGISIVTGSATGAVTITNDGTVGDITGVAAGDGLTGGGTSGDVTLTVVGGDGITANANDVAITAAQTTITSVLNAALVIGRDADNDIDFATDNNMIFRVGGEDQLTLVDGALTPSTNNIVDLGTDALEFKDAYFDGTVETDALTIGGSSIATVIAGTTVANATLAASFTASANNSTNEIVYPVFVDGATGAQAAETDTGLMYNPAYGVLSLAGLGASHAISSSFIVPFLGENHINLSSGSTQSETGGVGGTDVFLFVSGAVDGKEHGEGVALFGGDVLVSGNLMPLHLSASLTRLASGKSFLKAGSNVTIVTSSADGQVTITSSGGSTSPGGSTTFVQFNDGGAFGGDSGMVYAKNADHLTVSNVTVSAELGVADAISGTYYVPYSGDNSIQLTSGTVEHDKSDTFFFVSGSSTRMGQSAPIGQGHALIGGDLVISGAIRGGKPTGAPANLLRFISTQQQFGAGAIPVTTALKGPGSDTSFFVSGAVGAGTSAATRKTYAGLSVFGGDVIMSGSVLPGVDNTRDLGSSTNRWANIYTGDLHLKNDRGDWTMIEEPTYLSLRNNSSGKVYRILMEEVTE